MIQETPIRSDDSIFSLIDASDEASVYASSFDEFASKVKLDESIVINLVLLGDERGVLSREQLLRFTRLLTIYKSTLELFENDSVLATGFMLRPCKALGGVRPCECIVSKRNTQEALNVVGRLEHGIPN